MDKQKQIKEKLNMTNEQYDRLTALRVLQDLSSKMLPSLNLFGRPILTIYRQEFEGIRKKWLDNPKIENQIEMLRKEKQLAYDTVNGYSLTDIEQKAEIERLTEECQNISQSYIEVCDINAKLTQDVAYWERKHCTAVEEWEVEVYNRGLKIKELQNQVKELTEQRDVFKRLFESVNTSNLSTDSIIETMHSFYREQAEHLAGLKIEQAVKDAAKDIWDEITSYYFTLRVLGNATVELNKLAEFWHNHGVEVK